MTGSEHGVELVLRALGIPVDRGEAIHVFGGVEGERLQVGLQVVEQVGIGALGEHGAVVVGLEGSLDVLGLVGEVQHQRLVLAGMDAVEP